MSDNVISVEHVSKSYRLGLIGGGTLRDDVARGMARLFRRPDPTLRISEREQGNRNGELVWALTDVSFNVEQGEILGIIGRNGAGKSTILKILSQITAPTEGLLKVKGRIASLLEIGTGFHPELTGRENIFMNGAILGMTRSEITRKLDEIIAFAEIEQYIDTPVKRYSSGMYVRLAFAVAAHLDPEILIVDEVLAVGDAQFQKKCLGKMGDVARGGRTVLFVSHNMDTVHNLCSQIIVMIKGQSSIKLPIDDGIQYYLTELRNRNIEFRRTCLTTHTPIIESVTAHDQKGIPDSCRSGDGITFHVQLKDAQDIQRIECAIVLNSQRGQRVVMFQSRYHSGLTLAGERRMTMHCDVPHLPLVPASYIVDVIVGDGYRVLEIVEQAVTIDIRPFDLLGNGRVPDSSQGYLVLSACWNAEC